MYNNICLCLLLFSSCNFLYINILACYVFVFVFIAVNKKSKQNKQKMTQSVATHINVNFQPTYYLIVSFLFSWSLFFLKFYTYVCFLLCTSDMPTLSFTTRMQCVIPDAEIIIPSAENQRFQWLSPLSRSGSEYSCACLAFCQEFKPHHFYHPSFKKKKKT